jgi:hypothetical protein
MPHTLEQLRRGIEDFCAVVDQAAIGFMWNWIFFPKFLKSGVKQEDSVVTPDEVLEVVRKATIENSLISLRVLDEFFADTGVRPGDIRSHHYEGYRSPGRFLTRQEYDLIGRRITHLTVDRADSSQDPWKITDLIARSCQRSDNFLTFIVEGGGTKYLPAEPFDAASRLRTCRKMDGFMQQVLREGLVEKQKSTPPSALRDKTQL